MREGLHTVDHRKRWHSKAATALVERSPRSREATVPPVPNVVVGWALISQYPLDGKENIESLYDFPSY